MGLPEIRPRTIIYGAAAAAAGYGLYRWLRARPSIPRTADRESPIFGEDGEFEPEGEGEGEGEPLGPFEEPPQLDPAYQALLRQYHAAIARGDMRMARLLQMQIASFGKTVPDTDLSAPPPGGFGEPVTPPGAQPGPPCDTSTRSFEKSLFGGAVGWTKNTVVTVPLFQPNDECSKYVIDFGVCIQTIGIPDLGPRPEGVWLVDFDRPFVWSKQFRVVIRQLQKTVTVQSPLITRQDYRVNACADKEENWPTGVYKFPTARKVSTADGIGAEGIDNGQIINVAWAPEPDVQIHTQGNQVNLRISYRGVPQFFVTSGGTISYADADHKTYLRASVRAQVKGTP